MRRFDIYFIKSALRRHAIQNLYATLGEMLDHDDESSAGFADALRVLVEKDFKRTLKSIDKECARFFRQRRKRFSDAQYDAEFFCYLAELGIALPELERLRNSTTEEVTSEELAVQGTEDDNTGETIETVAPEKPEETPTEDAGETSEVVTPEKPEETA